MFFNGKICDGCGELMHDGEDIVVCPDCGTPQHRECYKKNNKCVNEHLHTESFDWQEANIEPVPEPVSESQQENSRPLKIEILNADEQSELPNGMNDFPMPLLSVDAVLMDGQGLKADDEFDGVKVSEALTYTQISAGKYLKKFIKAKGKKFFISWNWAAYFFSPAWFFFRKIYNLGAIFLTLTVAGVLLATPFSETLNENYDSYNETYEAYSNALYDYQEDKTAEKEAALDEATNKMMVQTKELAPSLAGYFALTFIIPNTIAAIIANGAYRKKMLDDISIAKKATKDPRILKYSLMRRGGVSLLAGIAALAAESYLPSIIMSIVTNFI